MDNAQSDENCIAIEISSEEDEPELESPKLFKDFVLRAATLKIVPKSVDYALRIFDLATDRFKHSENFINYLKMVLNEVDISNVKDLLTDVCRSLTTGNIAGFTDVSVGQSKNGPGSMPNCDEPKIPISETKNASAGNKAVVKSHIETPRDSNSVTVCKSSKPMRTEQKSRSIGAVLSEQKDGIGNAKSTGYSNTGKSYVGLETSTKRNTVPKETEQSSCETVITLPVHTLKDAHLNGDADDEDEDIQVIGFYPPRPPNLSITVEDKIRTDKKIRKEKAVKNLQMRLRYYEKEIKRLAQTELTLDEMDQADSNYLKECRLKEKYVTTYKKLCMLQGSADDLDNGYNATIKVESSPYPEINRAVEQFMSRKKHFPDLIDIRQIVHRANAELDLGLKVQDELDCAREVFSEVGNKIQKKRKKDFKKLSGSFLTDNMDSNMDPALTDLGLRKKLKINRKISKKNMEHVFRTYAHRQCEQKGEEESESSEDESSQKLLEKLSIPPRRLLNDKHNKRIYCSENNRSGNTGRPKVYSYLVSRKKIKLSDNDVYFSSETNKAKKPEHMPKRSYNMEYQSGTSVNTVTINSSEISSALTGRSNDVNGASVSLTCTSFENKVNGSEDDEGNNTCEVNGQTESERPVSHDTYCTTKVTPSGALEERSVQNKSEKISNVIDLSMDGLNSDIKSEILQQKQVIPETLQIDSGEIPSFCELKGKIRNKVSEADHKITQLGLSKKEESENITQEGGNMSSMSKDEVCPTKTMGHSSELSVAIAKPKTLAMALEKVKPKLMKYFSNSTVTESLDKREGSLSNANTTNSSKLDMQEDESSVICIESISIPSDFKKQSEANFTKQARSSDWNGLRKTGSSSTQVKPANDDLIIIDSDDD